MTQGKLESSFESIEGERLSSARSPMECGAEHGGLPQRVNTFRRTSSRTSPRREGDGEPSGPIRNRWNWDGIGEKRGGGRRQRGCEAMFAPAMLIKHQGMMCSSC
jgi:hypothetical protein